MINLLALAMNPNLSEAEFLALSNQIMDGRVRLLDTATEYIGKLPPEDRLQYVVAILPLLAAV